MNVAQLYETTIISDDSSHSARMVIVPHVGATASSDLAPPDILQELGLRKIAELEPANLAHALAIVLSPSAEESEVESRLKEASSADSGRQLAVGSADRSFAEIIAFDDLVPFRQSPLKQEVLAKLVTHATGAGVGAFVGFVAFGASPLLLVIVPAGMIICGAAKGVADALEQGLRDKLLALMKSKSKARRKRHN